VTDGLRSWLRARQLPTAEVPIPVDPVAHAAAERAVEVDRRTLQLAQAQEVDDLSIFRERLQAAQQHLDGLAVMVIRLRCLPPEDWEALVDVHPPTDEQRAAGWQWNVSTFRPALLAASVIADDDDRPLTEADWLAVAAEGQMRAGELDRVFAAAVNLNARAPEVSTGKG
jgi:hypothetical protein